MTVIDEVKSRIDIVDIVGEAVQLQRAGRNFRAACPFHTERTPSFYVSPDRQTWHCFGACATGGDALSFVMKRQNVEFPEALRILAERAGVTLSSQRDPQEDEHRKRLLQANEAAAAFFHNALLHSKPGEPARAYLVERGLDGEAIEAFELGFSLESWDALKDHLTERGYSAQELLETGLLVESERGGYDRFRGRLMFPIRDERGRVVGFGARALASTEGQSPDAPGAKYINTPQTPIFDKGALLYGLDRAKEAIRREKSVIVVEGYMDTIAAHQHGITNVVASMGTALTERQIRTLERFKSKVLLALDADAAGMEATLRALQEAGASGAMRATPAAVHPSELGEEEFNQRAQEWSRDALKRATVNFHVLALSGKDPDEMIRADRSAWDSALASARPFTDHLFETVAARKDLSQPGERAELLKELMPVVRLIDEPVFRAHYLQRLARLAQVSEDTLRQELGRRKRVGGIQSGEAFGTPTIRQGPPPTVADRMRREPREEYCLALLLRHPEIRTDAGIVTSELFLLGEHRAIFDAWRHTDNLEDIREALPEELHPQLDAVLARDLPFFEQPQAVEALQDCVRWIEKDRLRQAKRASSYALSEAGALGQNDEAANMLDMEQGLHLHRLTLERRRIKNERFSPQEGER